MRKIRLTESQFNSLVAKCVKQALSEAKKGGKESAEQKEYRDASRRGEWEAQKEAQGGTMPFQKQTTTTKTKKDKQNQANGRKAKHKGLNIESKSAQKPLREQDEFDNSDYFECYLDGEPNGEQISKLLSYARIRPSMGGYLELDECEFYDGLVRVSGNSDADENTIEQTILNHLKEQGIEGRFVGEVEFTERGY